MTQPNPEAQQVAAQPPAAPADTPPPAAPPGEEIDWKAMARKWEGQAKENKAAADELAQLKDAQKSDAQKQADKLAALQAEIDGYKARDQIAEWAKEVSAAEGVPVDLLRGSTRDELEAHAKQLKPILAAAPGANPGPLAPAVPGIGNVPETRNIPLRDQIAAAEKAGDKALVATLKAMQLTTVPAAY